MSAKDILKNPWPGLSPYEDPAKSDRKFKFCGRDNAIYDVAQLIDNNFLVTLYGRSGIGKTSLLNAGVFPVMRLEQYTPLRLRLGIIETDSSYQDLITDAIEYAIKEIKGRIKIYNVVELQKDRTAVDYLWNYFARRQFFDDKGNTVFPIIVIDQFEENLRNVDRRRKAEILLDQIHYLINENHALNDCIVEGEEYFYDFNFRFVISIREDELYRLEDCIDNLALPALKQCRYRLRSFSEQEARDAILIPGDGLFDSIEQEGIVNAIISKSRNEDGSISTNIISLLCNRIFTESQKNGAKIISKSLVNSFIKGNPFERFYNEATRDFSDKEKRYIEEHLVDSARHRNSVSEADFLSHVPNGVALLEGDYRILQRISTSSSGGHTRIELIHDSFCYPLLGLKEKRERRRRIKGFILGALILLFCIVIAGYFVKQKREMRILKLNIHTLAQINGDSIDVSEVSFGVFEINEIRYYTPQPTAQDILSWKKEFDGLCREKIELIKSPYSIPKDMLEGYPSLVYLILTSRSISLFEEKQSWFDLWPQMNKEQINQLYVILYKERYKLAEIETKYKNKRTEIENKWEHIDDFENSNSHQQINEVVWNNNAYDFANKGKYENALVLEVSPGVFEKDGIRYFTSEPTQQDLLNWRKEFDTLCKEKIHDKLSFFSIPQNMFEQHPCLVYLILTSKIIDSHKEKQSLFDLWSKMDTQKINQLYNLLYRERYNLAQIEVIDANYQERIKNYESRTGHLPFDDVKLGNSEAYDYANKGEYENALLTIDGTIELALVNYVNVLDSKGEILLMQDEKNIDAADSIWKQILKLVPDFLDHHEGSTKLYEKLKEQERVN